MPSKDRGEKKVAFVTGGATGIGASVCVAFAKMGFDLALNFRSQADSAKATAARCRAAGAQVAQLKGDVSKDSDCRVMIAKAVEKFGRLDILVNSAAVTQFVPMDDLDGIDAADFERVYSVNVIGPFQMIRAAAPHLRATKGAVVNVSSIAGVVGNGSSIAYVASKAALNAMTVALARSLGPDIRVNAVLPGLVRTDWVRRGVGDEAYDRVERQWANSAALGKVATADGVAEHIVFLATGATLMTGQLVTIDGGFLLGRPVKVSR